MNQSRPATPGQILKGNSWPRTESLKQTWPPIPDGQESTLISYVAGECLLQSIARLSWQQLHEQSRNTG